ncbi:MULTISPECIES: hypothetical protein [Aliagarivorans]|uniref:hypothetical protein n=1 Tax=Aliagarivorans TaxID=882379 RepID=UPI0004049790|nr:MULTISPECIES: hypothetical protein [Aliagarivorans]
MIDKLSQDLKYVIEQPKIGVFSDLWAHTIYLLWDEAAPPTWLTELDEEEIPGEVFDCWDEPDSAVRQGNWLLLHWVDINDYPLATVAPLRLDELTKRGFASSVNQGEWDDPTCIYHYLFAEKHSQELLLSSALYLVTLKGERPSCSQDIADSDSFRTVSVPRYAFTKEYQRVVISGGR